MAKRSHSGTLLDEDQPESSADDVAFRLCVDEVLLNHWKSERLSIIFNPNIKEYTQEDVLRFMANTGRVMILDQVLVTELCCELWDNGYKTSFADISPQTIPHFRTTQAFINYVLNVDEVDIGLAKNYFTRLLTFHPPNSFPMEVYYWHVLNDTFIKMKGIEANDTVFWFCIESLLICFKDPEFLAEPEESLFGIPELSKGPLTSENFLQALRTSPYSNPTASSSNSATEFPDPSEADKFQRTVVVIEFLTEVFEADFLFRTITNRFIAVQNRAIFSQFLWRNATEVGSANNYMKRIAEFFIAMENLKLNHMVTVHRRLLTLMGEVVRCNGYKDNLYPFFGTASEEIAGEIAAQLYDDLKKNKNKEIVKVVKVITPHWLRLLVCCKLLSYLSCKKYFPELRSVHDILSELIFLNVKTRDLKTFHLNDNELTKKRPKSEESLLNLGMKYCYEGCVLEVCSTLEKEMKLASMQINKTDQNGWAPLHRAILLRHEKCVDEILKFKSSVEREEDSIVKADARLKGYKDYTPIMCALIKEDGDICRLLLEHSGPRILEDINMNGETAFDLCYSFDVGKVIKSTGKTSINSPKFYLTLDDEVVVTALCVQFVESYISTHRTREVIERLKTEPPNPKDMDSQICWNPIKWDYNRYREDINVNIKNILELVKLFDGDEVSKHHVKMIEIIFTYSTNW